VFRVVIPARYGSTRLPGKALLPMAGKPMIQWVWERARKSRASEVIVATDDARIAEAATQFGAVVTMTDPARGFQRTYQTTEDGTFNVTDLPASTYTLTVEMQGFKKYQQENFQVTVNDRRSLNIVLDPGEVTELVTVVASLAGRAYVQPQDK